MKYSEAEAQEKMTVQDLIRLAKLNFWCKPHEILERSQLRRKALKLVLNLVISILVWLCSVLLVLMGLIPPYVSAQFVLMAVGLIGVLVLLPRMTRLYRRWLNGWGGVAVKGFVMMVMVVAVAWYPAVSQMKKDAVAEAEREKITSMTPDERYWYEENKRREAQLAEEVRRKAEAENERERKEQEVKEWNAKEAEREKAAAIERQADMKLENSRQRDFYDELGSPKILYKCNNSDLEKAIGAKYGNINLILSSAQENCGSSGYQILKRQD